MISLAKMMHITNDTAIVKWNGNRKRHKTVHAKSVRVQRTHLIIKIKKKRVFNKFSECTRASRVW